MKVRIEGDGSSRGTRVVNAETGEVLEGVEHVVVTLDVHGKPEAVITIRRPHLALDLDASVAPV